MIAGAEADGERVAGSQAPSGLGSIAAGGHAIERSAGEARQLAASATRGKITMIVPHLCLFSNMTGADDRKSYGAKSPYSRAVSRPAPGSGREIFVVLALFALVLVGVGGAVLLARDVRPLRRRRWC